MDLGDVEREGQGRGEQDGGLPVEGKRGRGLGQEVLLGVEKGDRVVDAHAAGDER